MSGSAARRGFALEWVVLLYFLTYLPNIIVTKLVTSRPHPGLGRPLTGLETLPASLIMSAVLTALFVWLSGWYRAAHGMRVGPLRLPRPTGRTILSGIGTALVLFTVPLSFTIPNVSIPFIQLLMRGDILLIAPLVDLAFGRRVRWWSWGALALVAAALSVTVSARGGFRLPPLAIVTVVLYTLGFFIRLAVMTGTAKTGDQDAVQRYFVEEKIVALPLAVAALAGLSALGLGGPSGQLGWGFVAVWRDPVMLPLTLIAATLTAISIFSVVILLDARENSYCVPLERASSLVAGVAAAFLLTAWGLPRPSGADTVGALLLIAAILLLSVAPRRARAATAESP